MKKYILTAFTVVLAIFLQSCLKDKGFDRYEYGSKPGADGGPAVSFPLGSGTKDTAQVVGSIAPSTTPFASTNVIFVELENTAPLTTATVVTIALNPGLLNGTGLTPFPAGAVTVPTTVTIPAGQLSAPVPITFTNSSLLNLTSTYGLGLTITGVSNGFKIVNTRYNVVARYGVKNIYDGTYSAVGYFYHPSSPREIKLTGTDAIVLSTVNATSVKMQLGDLSAKVIMTIDPATNVVTSITDFNNVNVGVAPTSLLSSLPAGYTPFPGSNPSIYNNTYNPSTHQFFLRYGYLGGTGYRVVEEVLTLQ